MTLWIYDHLSKTPLLLRLPPWAQMPFVERFAFPAGTFLGRSHTSFAWSDRRALEALDALAALFPVPFSVSHAFADPALPSPHGSGSAFNIGRDLSPRQRTLLRHAAVRSGLFYRVSPDVLAPDCVHIEALAPRTLKPGDVGADVCQLQALLQHGGAHSVALSGTYCEETRRAVLRAQHAHSLPQTGNADAEFLRGLLR